LRPAAGFNEEYALNLAQLGAPERAEAFLLSLGPGHGDDRGSRAFALGCAQVMQWKHQEASASLWLAHTRFPRGHYFKWVSVVNWMWCLLYLGQESEILSQGERWLEALEGHPILQENLRLCMRKAAVLSGEQRPNQESTPAALVSPYDTQVSAMVSWLEGCLSGDIPRSRWAFGVADLQRKARAQALWELDRELAMWRFVLGFIASDDESSTAGAQPILWATPFAGAQSYLAHLMGIPLICSFVRGTRLARLQNLLQARPPALHLNLGSETTKAASDQEALSVQELLQRYRLPETSAKLLRALASDCFRPHSAAKLTFDLTDGFSYHPESDDKRLRVAVMRLRRQIQGLGLNWQVVANKGHGYNLICESPAFQAHASLEPVASVTKAQAAYQVLVSRFASEEFTREALQEALLISERTANRWLAEWVQCGDVCRQDRGRKTTYRLQLPDPSSESV
jgi:hypothetical protein